MSENIQIETKWHTIPKLFMMSTTLPGSIVDDINKYLDNLLSQKSKNDHSGTLVGQIKNGEQLTIDINDPLLDTYRAISIQMCAQYMEKFKSQVSSAGIFSKKQQIDFDEVWSVHSFKGDYNPRHDHGTQSKTGLSSTLWTKVPEGILSNPQIGGLGYSTNNSSGHFDGCIDFLFSELGARSTEDLHPSGALTYRPEVGRMFVFPSWLNHTVYPFDCEGERRTVAANFNIWNSKEK
jgi:hypothetical protein